MNDKSIPISIESGSIFDIMFGGLNSNSTRPFIIENFPEPTRNPSNLKYPNKRRKMRVWKKWCNRYGWKNPRYIVIPRVRFNGVMLKDGETTISYTAEEIPK